MASFQQTSAQETQQNFWQNVRYGGGLGLSFGNGFFSGTLAPSAIYQFDERFAAGIGLNGTYNSLRDTYNSTIFGGSIIGLYNVITQIQFSAEFEQLHVTRKYELDGANLSENYFYPGLYAGVGYTNGNVTVGLKYDVLFDERRSIYADPFFPFIRVFF
ncbi:alpha-ketoglutarate decarboxylase [Aequorivita echinoideorum]|uniref:Alpha-ketoglutarate decarboxylase n=2 Tax=Aequorivita echinoideorum TaxID=1549647 RepID=A0ABS5S4A0_9FLAO|nr:alpha-ketoglutarate decarboxylase [Aequorivita echinoideorum]